MTPMFSLPTKNDLIKAGIKFILVILAAIATYLESYIPGLLQTIIVNPVILPLILAVNTGIIDLIRKFITDEEGKIAGITLVIK